MEAKSKKPKTETPKPIAKSAEAIKKELKQRRAAKKALCDAQARNAENRLDEIVAARKQAGRESKQKKTGEHKKASKRMALYKKSIKETPALRKAKHYDGKAPKYSSKAKAKNAAA